AFGKVARESALRNALAHLDHVLADRIRFVAKKMDRCLRTEPCAAAPVAAADRERCVRLSEQLIANRAGEILGAVHQRPRTSPSLTPRPIHQSIARTAFFPSS